jgi:hypothetical protein
MITKPKTVPRKIPPTKIAMAMAVTPYFFKLHRNDACWCPETSYWPNPGPSVYPKLYITMNSPAVNPPKYLISDR